MLTYIFDMRIHWCIAIAFDCYSQLGKQAVANFWDMPPDLSRPFSTLSSSHPMLSSSSAATLSASDSGMISPTLRHPEYNMIRPASRRLRCNRIRPEIRRLRK